MAKDQIHEILELFIAALPAGLGGFIHALWSKKSFQESFTEGLVALFTGFVVANLLCDICLGTGTKGAIIASSGWSASKVLPLLTKMLLTKGGIPRNEREE